jgi:hypothetical protein
MNSDKILKFNRNKKDDIHNDIDDVHEDLDDDDEKDDVKDMIYHH